MASKRKILQEDARLRILRLLSETPELSSRQIAEIVGISHGSAYYILIALIEKGFVKLENFKNNSQKRYYSYLLTPKGIHEKSSLAIRFIKRKRKEFEELRKEIDILEHEAQLLRSDPHKE